MTESRDYWRGFKTAIGALLVGLVVGLLLCLGLWLVLREGDGVRDDAPAWWIPFAMCAPGNNGN